METKTLLNTGNSALWVVEDYIPEIYEEDIHGLYLQQRPEITVRGRVCRQNRDVGFFSNVSEGYRYSGQMIEAQHLWCTLPEILDSVNNSLGTNFNGILINRYESGENSIGAHSDDESALSGNKVACISFGAKRLFRVREKKSGKVVLDYEIPPCSLLVMDGDFQKEFTHEVPVRKKIKDTRWSLTFRHHSK